MQINKERFESYWKIKNGKIEDDDNLLLQRCDWLKDIFAEINETKVEEKEQTVIINGETLSDFNVGAFGPREDGNVAGTEGGGGPACLKKVLGKLKDESDSFKLANNIWKMLIGTPGKYGKSTEKHYRIYYLRIFANGNSDRNDTLTVCRNVPDVFFASNNYFFQIVRFIQKAAKKPEAKLYEMIESQQENQNDHLIPLVATWNEDETRKLNILDQRFVLKFLWMWANKEKQLCLPSLSVMRAFCDSELLKEIISQSQALKESPELKDIDDNRKIIDLKYDDFISVWNEISQAVFTLAGIDDKNDASTQLDISRMLTYLLSDDVQSSVDELLTSGNQCVILFGAPGTGKTYTAKQMVAKLLKLDDKINKKQEEANEQNEQFDCSKAMEMALKEHSFSKENKSSDSKTYSEGAWQLVQFHPAYTYEDFIGGIRPNLESESGTLSFKLVDGHFKAFCDEAKKAKNKSKKFIFIIDEINRANLSAVFGRMFK